jgi:hypothetical protein
MLDLKIAQYKDNAKAPVIFMIDDIANISIKNSSSTKLQVGEDWGQYGQNKNSMWDFLSKQLLDKFPHIKTTFFLVTDKRAPMALSESYSYNEAITKDEKFKTFLQFLDKHPNVELAYHGTTHGTAFDKHEEFLQEWETFRSLEHAIEEINRGKELFKSVVDHYPLGGKYCGYQRGEFGDISIAKANFRWWCYHWDGIIWDRGIEDTSYNYDLSLNHGVVDIPTTVDASTLSLKIIKKIFTRKYLKSCYLYLFKAKSIEKHLDSLYKNGQVIAIQEHTSPYRTDNIIQYPNIVMDIDNLKYIFTLLSKKDVWYATCSELANYYLTKNNSKIKQLQHNEFVIESHEVIRSELTITISFRQGDYYLYDHNQQEVGQFKSKRGRLYITSQFQVNSSYFIVKKN